MLQFDVALCRTRDNVAHKVRRYIHFFVASELVSDVERFVANRVHVARTNNKQVRLRRISAFLPEASFRVPEALCESISTRAYFISELFNTAGGGQLAVNRLFQLLGEILDWSSGLKAQYAPARPGDVLHSLADISKARTLLGYHPKVTAREGFERTVEWYKLKRG